MFKILVLQLNSGRVWTIFVFYFNVELTNIPNYNSNLTLDKSNHVF